MRAPLSSTLAVRDIDMCAWQFSPSIGGERVKALLRSPAFEEIVDIVAREMEVLCCHRPCCDDMPGFSRVVFNLRISRETFDLFFNAEHGYRGSYFLSPYSGLAANDVAIKRLTPLLLSWAEQHQSNIDQAFAAESLAAPSAKVWLTEYGSHLCEKCVGEWGNPTDETPEILNGRWELAVAPNGRRGRKAPFFSKLRVFGAFLDGRNNEFVPARKRYRASDINAEGWS